MRSREFWGTYVRKSTDHLGSDRPAKFVSQVQRHASKYETSMGDNVTVRLSGGRTADVNFKSVDEGGTPLNKLLAFVQLARAAGCSEQVATEGAALSKKNAALREINTALTAARLAGAAKEQGTGGANGAAAAKIMQKYGISISSSVNDKDKDIRAKGWDAVIQNIQTFTETMNSNSQLDMQRLQEVTNKFNQSFDLLSSWSQKFNKMIDDIMQVR